MSRNVERRAALVSFIREQDVRLSWTWQLSLDWAVFRYAAIDDVLSLREAPGNSSYEQDDGSPSFYRIFGKQLLLHKKNETIPPEHFI